MTFYCPTSWGNLIFGSEPSNVFNAGNSWGVFHEINHNFEQNAAFFRRRTHGETNQVTAFNLSIISDITRFRNEINYTGENVSNNYNNGWCYLDTPYSIMKRLHRQGLNLDNEYPIYSILLFFMGSKNYAEYVRKDVREHSSGSANWTGISEIGRISDTFKLNMWPAFKDYSQYWYDWSTSYEEASQSDKEIIDRIQSYKAVDFVSNQYACGSYLYNSDTNEYTYTNDVLPAFEIPPSSPYTLDFETMITSTNRNFNFSSIEFEPSTKLGGKLQLDPANNKKLIYTPPVNNFAEIDEFDVSIIPGEWEDKPSNYVDKYKFKIKLRQEVNSAVIETFEPLSNNSNPAGYFNELDTLSPKYAPATKIPTIYFEDSQKRGIKIKYRFVAPKDGTYVFKNKYDDYIKIFADNQLVFSENRYSSNFKQTYSKELKQGETINFENVVINTGGAGAFSLQILCDNEEINAMDNIVSPYINLDNNNYLDLLSNPEYKYKSREVNREIFNKSLTATNNLSTYSIMDTIIDPEKYTLSSSDNRNVQNLNNFNDNTVEIWGSGSNPTTLELIFNFTEPQHLASIFVAGRTNNWTNARPTKITVTGYESDTSNDEIIIHDGDYGIEFSDRLSAVSKMNFTNPQTVKRAKIKLINDKPVSGSQTALSLKWVRLSNRKFFSISNQFGFNDQLMNISKGWVFRRNDELNSSALNNIYASSNQAGNRISFTLNNCSGFSIIGQLNNKNPTTFDIYINDVLQTVNYDTNDKLIYNDALFTYKTDSLQKIKVEIVSRTSDPLYLNYVMTFGEGVYLS